jgi:hypothetical protein
LRSGLDAGNIRIFGTTGGLTAFLFFAGFKAPLLFLLLALLLCLFACALVCSGARILWHQGFSLPALMAAATSPAAIATSATTEPAAFAWGFRTRFIHSDRAAFEVCPIELRDGISGFLF